MLLLQIPVWIDWFFIGIGGLVAIKLACKILWWLGYGICKLVLDPIHFHRVQRLKAKGKWHPKTKASRKHKITR